MLNATVSPMCSPSTLATAMMSPGYASGTGWFVFPWIIRSWDTRAVFPVRTLSSGWAASSLPDRTRMKLRLPTNLSFTVLNTTPRNWPFSSAPS